MMAFILGGWEVNESVIWCLIGGFIGMYVLIKNLRIMNKHIDTPMSDAFPILLGTLSWLTAAITFYITNFDSPIDTQRVMMIILWGMLATRVKLTDFKLYRPK